MTYTNSKLEIVRWDALIQPKSAPKAGLYIVPPTQDMADFLLSHEQFVIKITDTNSGYDDILCFATAIPSEIAGGFRPNYQDQTNTLVIFPLIAWDGYPPNLGNVTILDYAEAKKIEAYENSLLLGNTPHEANYRIFVWGVCMLVIVFGIYKTQKE